MIAAVMQTLHGFAVVRENPNGARDYLRGDCWMISCCVATHWDDAAQAQSRADAINESEGI